MKLTRTLFVVSAFGFLFNPHSEAQTTLLKPTVTHSFAAKRADTPVLHRTTAYGCYELLFPGTEYSPARRDRPYGYAVQDRAEIAPGVEIRMPNIKNDFDKDFDVNKPPPLLKIGGREQTIDFGRFLVDPMLWSHEVLNQTKYELGIPGYGKNAYRYIGLVQSRGKTYLGVCWYDSGSESPDTNLVVFRLNWSGSTVEAEPIHQLAGIVFKWPPLPLLLDTAPNGDLLLSASGELSQMSEKGDWSPSNVSEPLIKKYPELAAYSMKWHIGQWLVTGHQQATGKTIMFNLTVSDGSTGKKVSGYAWSVSAK